MSESATVTEDKPGDESARMKTSPRRKGMIGLAIVLVVCLTGGIAAYVAWDNSQRDAAAAEAASLTSAYQRAIDELDAATLELSGATEVGSAYLAAVAQPARDTLSQRVDSFGQESVDALLAAANSFEETLATEPAATLASVETATPMDTDELAAVLHRGSSEEKDAAKAEITAATKALEADVEALSGHASAVRTAIDATDVALVTAARAGYDQATATLDSKPEAPGDIRAALDAQRAALAAIAETALPIDRFSAEYAAEADALATAPTAIVHFHDSRVAVASYTPPPPPPAPRAVRSGGSNMGGCSGVRFDWGSGVMVPNC